jgi:hypothetical protein
MKHLVEIYNTVMKLQPCFQREVHKNKRLKGSGSRPVELDLVESPVLIRNKEETRIPLVSSLRERRNKPTRNQV